MNQAENSSLSLAAFDIHVRHIIATRPQILAHSWKKFSGCYWRHLLHLNKIFRGYFLCYCSFWLGLTQDVRGGGGWGWGRGWGGGIKKREGAECPHFQSAACLSFGGLFILGKRENARIWLWSNLIFIFMFKWLVKKGYMWRQEERYTNTLQKLLIKTYNNNENKALVPKLWGWLSVL